MVPSLGEDPADNEGANESENDPRRQCGSDVRQLRERGEANDRRASRHRSVGVGVQVSKPDASHAAAGAAPIFASRQQASVLPIQGREWPPRRGDSVAGRGRNHWSRWENCRPFPMPKAAPERYPARSDTT
jgi:hypothetical protein